jgi:hypothetical protein
VVISSSTYFRKELPHEVGIVGQCGGSLACAFGQIALGQGLQPPGEAFDQPGFVAGPGGFTEQVGVAAAQVGDAQARQPREFVGQVVGHGWLLFGGCRLQFPF